MASKPAFFSSAISLRGLLSVITVLTVLASVAGFFGYLGWWLDLFSHFRLQYAGILLVTSCTLTLLRQYKIGLLGFVALALNVNSIYPYYVTAATDYPQTPFRAIQLNVNTSQGQPDKVLEYLLSEAPDFIVLEEVDSSWIEKLSLLEMTYPHHIKAPRDDNFGIALYSRYAILESQTLYFGDANVPTISALLETQQGKLQVIGTHTLPPVTRSYAQLRDEHLYALSASIRGYIHPVLLLGDLNTTHWSDVFKNMIKQSGLRDCAQGYGLHPSWPADFALARIPIDHCLYSTEIQLHSKTVGPNISSDHLPLVVLFSLPNITEP